MSARKRLVVASLESADGWRCIDIVAAPDGTFRWDEWRRDPEDPRGWRATGAVSGGDFGDQSEAEADARARFHWINS